MYLSRLKKFIGKNKSEVFILALILLLGAVLRLYRIDEYMTFLGDEGRDAIIVRRFLVNFDPILIGPGTSIGNMYLGPLYYYLIAPALLIAGFSPVGPSVFVALLGVLTIGLVWFFARILFPVGSRSINVGAIVASLMYAISPIVIVYSRSSWNPNVMPLFSLLCIYGIWKSWSSLDYRYLILVGISYAFVLQSHYLGLLLAPTLFVFWILMIIRVLGVGKNNLGKEGRKALTYFFAGLLIFLFLMSPLVIFDIRHGWQNFSAIKKFFIERETTVSIKPWKAVPNMFPIWKDAFITRIVAGKNVKAGLWVSFAMFDLVILYFVRYFKALVNIVRGKASTGDGGMFISSLFLLSLWIFFGILGLSLYKQHIYDHYFGFMFTAPFILFGGLFGYLWNKFGLLTKTLLLIGLFACLYLNLIENPLKYPPNRQMQRSQVVAQKIGEESNGKKFNLAVIAERNYEDGYQYFLEKDGYPVYDIDPLNLSDTIADQLFVVCEMEANRCDPTHSAKAEIANFGWSRIEAQWEVGGLTLYKLIHSK